MATSGVRNQAARLHQDLGFAAIPGDAAGDANCSGLDYHGYHATTSYRVDPRLESPGRSYREFIQAAHAKGSKVIQDVVLQPLEPVRPARQDLDRSPARQILRTGGSSQGLINNGPYQGNLWGLRQRQSL